MRGKDIGAHNLADVNGTLFFTPARQPSSLWKSDGTKDGTVLVKEMNARGLISVDDTLFFAGPIGNNERALWMDAHGPVGNTGGCWKRRFAPMYG